MGLRDALRNNENVSVVKRQKVVPGLGQINIISNIGNPHLNN
jgi:hypothetical protein